MRVKFVGGPLDGREKEISDDKLGQGQPVYWPDRPEVDDNTDLEQPGLDGVVEYLYDGNGRASYVGGQLEVDVASADARRGVRRGHGEARVRRCDRLAGLVPCRA